MAKHIAHFQQQMQAATNLDPNWEQFTQFEDVDFDHDSQAPSEAGEEEEHLMDEDSTSAGNSNVAMFSTPFQPQAAAFQTAMASPFTALGHANAQGDDPVAMAAVQLLKENGVSEQDVHVRAAQLHHMDMSAGPMVAPGAAPDEY